MIDRGTVRGDTVILPPGLGLPDGLEVKVEPVFVPSVAGTTALARQDIRNGVPVFPRLQSGVGSSLELVNQFRDETL